MDQTKPGTIKQLEPEVSRKIKYTTATTRQEEVTITRLGMGHCCTNSYLCKIKRRSDPYCQHCSQPEDVNHLITCPHNHLLDNMPTININNILTDAALYHQLYLQIAKMQRRL